MLSMRGGLKEHPAWSTKTPGLVVHKEPGGKAGEFTVSHSGSGLAINRKMSYHHAQDLATRMGPLTDWTQGPDALKSAFKNDNDLDARRREEVSMPPPLPPPPKRPSKAKPVPKNLLLDELQSDWGQKFTDFSVKEIDRWEGKPGARRLGTQCHRLPTSPAPKNGPISDSSARSTKRRRADITGCLDAGGEAGGAV